MKKNLYIVLYHCGEDEYYYFNSLKEIKKFFHNYKKDEYFVGIYKVEKIIFEKE